ncbi:hypothetical protein GXW83_29575 [Streptacidiphilus sp. PB12-B1b]|nr:DUF6020 family protein [Streptacidiphilus sp. PB12-B1b]QMU79238.1 hypothetical protein GXW83_29575 [Streptacidiphilus sp. PB12-B1b]
MTEAEIPPGRRPGLAGAVTARVRPLVQRIPARLRMPLGIAAMSQLVFLVWWSAFYPGLMSYDSFDYTWEVTTGHWVDDHSIAYDGAVWLTLNVTGDYAVLTLLQTIAMAAVLGYLAAGMRKFAISNKWITAGVLLCLVLPPTGSFMIFVWKDVPFVIGGVLGFAAITHLTAAMLKVRPRRARQVGLRRDWLLLGLGMTLVCLARNNGFLGVFLIGVLLLLALPWLWKRVAAVILIPIVIFFALDSGLYPALGVTKPADSAAYTFVYSDIAYAYSKAPTTFTASDLTVMAKVSPLEHWSTAGAVCVSTDKLTTPAFHTGIAAKHNSQLLHIFSEVMKRTPQYVFESSLCRAHNAWAVFPGYDAIGIAGVASSPNGYGLMKWHPDMYHSQFYSVMKVRPLSDTLHTLGTAWYNSALTSQLIWLLWGGAVWCYVAYGVVIGLVRKVWRREVLALAVVTGGMQLNVLAATPSALYRYMATPTYLGILLLPFLFSKLTRQAPETQDAPSAAPAENGASEELEHV